MWQVTTLAAQGEVNTPTFLHGLSEIFGAISGVVFIGADCPWLGRTRVLRCGEVTPAEILAVQAKTTVYRHPNNWRYVTPSKQNEVKAQLKRPQDTVENRQRLEPCPRNDLESLSVVRQ